MTPKSPPLPLHNTWTVKERQEWLCASGLPLHRVPGIPPLAIAQYTAAVHVLRQVHWVIHHLPADVGPQAMDWFQVSMAKGDKPPVFYTNLYARDPISLAVDSASARPRDAVLFEYDLNTLCSWPKHVPPGVSLLVWNDYKDWDLMRSTAALAPLSLDYWKSLEDALAGFKTHLPQPLRDWGYRTRLQTTLPPAPSPAKVRL